MAPSYIISHCDVCFQRIGPEKGVIHLATAAVNNALWDMFARARGKPLWKLIVDMTPVCDIYFALSRFTSTRSQEELVNAAAFRYITDVLTREEALAMLKAKEGGKREREALVTEIG